MRCTGLATYARTHSDVALWAALSLKESRIRREHAHVRVRTVLGVSGFGLALYLMLIWTMGPTP